MKLAQCKAEFEEFARSFIRSYWETVKSGAFPMPPNEPVLETLEALFSEISHEIEFGARSEREAGSFVLRMMNTHGDWWSFKFRKRGRRWELTGASARSLDNTNPHDLLGPIYAQSVTPFLQHVVRIAHESSDLGTRP